MKTQDFSAQKNQKIEEAKKALSNYGLSDKEAKKFQNVLEKAFSGGDKNLAVFVLGENLEPKKTFDIEEAGKEQTSTATDDFFSKIVREINEEELSSLSREASILGLDFSEKRKAIIFHLENFKESLLDSTKGDFTREDIIEKWKRRVSSAIKSFFTLDDDVIVSYLGDGKFLTLKTTSNYNETKFDKRLKKSFESIILPLKDRRISSITIGFGDSYTGLRGANEACKEASLALDIGLRTNQKGSSHHHNDFGILSAIAETNGQKKAKWADGLLSQLDDETLVKTLRTFLDSDLNITDTSEKLNIHRNTAIYRIDQIADRLNLDPRNFDDAVKIKLAFSAKELYG